jgi:MFS family permease
MPHVESSSRGAIEELERALKSHPLVKTLVGLRGNVRGCVYTEPLWGIPFNLYAPYVSVYMLTLGLTDSRIGLVVTIGQAFQVLWTMLSGALTDKLGRKRATLIFDLLSWSVPCLIWAVAQNFTYFVAAAIVNAMWRVPHNSWNLLLVEDTNPDLLVDVWSWVQIAGLIAAFVSPLTGLLIAQFSLVPTIRGLYLLAFVMMTIKFVIMNSMVTETKQGVVRMAETRGQPLFAVLRGYPTVLRRLLGARVTLLTAALMLVLQICLLIRGAFWSILVTEKLLIPDEYLALYAFARSIIMLAFYFLAMPRLRDLDARKSITLGFLGLILSYVLLISVPPGNYWLLLLATAIEACSMPMANTILQKLIVVNVEAEERARIMAILNMGIILFTSPFGWIAGRMSEVNRSLPFILSIALFGLGVLLTYFVAREGRRGAVEGIAEEPAQV